MSELLKGALFTKLTLNVRFLFVGTLLMVRNCEPKLVERVQEAFVEPNAQLGLVWKRLLNVVCTEEFIVIVEFAGRASLLNEK
jgi:hypothetical protein